MKNKLFVKVRCRAYLKMIKDSVHIELFHSDSITPVEQKYVYSGDCYAFAYKYDPTEHRTVVIADLSDFCGQSVEKTYRERIEEDFVGFVVGYTNVNVKGIIGTDWYCDPYRGEFGHCFKQTTETAKVAVVYFKNNAKRYVPLEDLEVL